MSGLVSGRKLLECNVLPAELHFINAGGEVFLINTRDGLIPYHRNENGACYLVPDIYPIRPYSFRKSDATCAPVIFERDKLECFCADGKAYVRVVVRRVCERPKK